jgi:hypothetical protein
MFPKQVFADRGNLNIEQSSQRFLRQPEILILKHYFNFLIAIGSAVKDDFVVFVSPPTICSASQLLATSRALAFRSWGRPSKAISGPYSMW